MDKFRTLCAKLAEDVRNLADCLQDREGVDSDRLDEAQADAAEAVAELAKPEPRPPARWINDFAVAGCESADILYAHCSDSTIWSMVVHGDIAKCHWLQLLSIPQPEDFDG